MSLRLEPLENLSEAVQARLAHPIQRVGPLDLTEVGRSIAACGVEDVCLAVHILDHEVLPLESNATFDLISPESMNRMRNISPASTRAGVSICAFLSTQKWRENKRLTNREEFRSLILLPVSVSSYQNWHSLVALLSQQVKSLLCHLQIAKIILCINKQCVSQCINIFHSFLVKYKVTAVTIDDINSYIAAR